ncbi:hypothetical protein WAF17_06625 [Bernardetia sp. ABR2-2B]|uniref:hypothetical protein n=1 Tax=Bernardetia sp. ABR2-2B TaxID=3127472 RepID=UPI0030D19969
MQTKNYRLIICFLLLSSLFFIHFSSSAQVYTEKKTRHRFAQTYFGLSTKITPISGSLVWQNQEQKFPMAIMPHLNLGGLHFWGKLDFNMTLPLINLGSRKLQNDGEVEYRSAGSLSVRYYPWRMEFKKLRPYAGVFLDFSTLTLGNDTQSKRYDSFIMPIPVGGVSFAFKNWQINAETTFLLNNEKIFYSSEIQANTFKLPRTSFSLGVVRYFDFTLKEEKPKELGKTAKITAALAAKRKLNSFSIGFAPSASFFIKSPQFSEELESLPLHKSSFNFDIGVGYFFYKAKLHTGFSYRNYSSKSISYSLEHIVRRQSIAFEAYKFLFDYNGFVPFIGASISSEKWATGLFRNDTQQGEIVRTEMISPGIIFGWDIVPSPLDTWVLRTNLRYYPFQEINDIDGKKSRVDQFEFNFIQFVIYPNRIINFRKAKKGFYKN